MTTALARGSILVVDDDPDLRDVVTGSLEDEGYEVIAASGGQEALDLLRRGARPALILLDMMMPGLDGRQFRAEQVKDPEWAAIPTVIFSAYVNVAETALALAAAGGLQKPIRMDALLAVVERFVGAGETARTCTGVGGEATSS